MTPRMLLLGGNGLIGRHLRVAAERRGWSVSVVALHPGAHVQACSSDMALSNLVRSERWDSIVDLRAFNARDTKTVTQAMNPHGAYLLVSSIYAYCHPRHNPERNLRRLEEEALMTPTGPYGLGKAEAEREALTSPVDTSLVVRLPYVFGAGDRTQRTKTLAALASISSEWPGLDHEVGLVSAPLVAERLVLLAEKRPADRHVLNVDGGVNWSLADHYKAARCVGWSKGVSAQVGYAVPFDPGRDYSLDSRKFHELLGVKADYDLERQWRDVDQIV